VDRDRVPAGHPDGEHGALREPPALPARHRRGHLVVKAAAILLAAGWFYSEIVLLALLVSYLGYTAWYNLVPAVRRWEDRPDEVDELERSEPSGAEQVGA
jgi:hypothetical protein